jgi:hypothetical protein
MKNIVFVLSIFLNLYLFFQNGEHERSQETITLAKEFELENDSLKTKEKNVDESLLDLEQERFEKDVVERSIESDHSTELEEDTLELAVDQRQESHDYHFSDYETIDGFLREGLNLPNDEVEQILKKIDNVAKQESQYFSDKVGPVDENGKSQIYMLGPDDYIFLGTIRKKTRGYIKEKLGGQYKKFLDYVSFYNQRSEGSFIDI